MANPAAIGSLTRLAVSAMGSTSPATKVLFYSSFDPGCTEDFLDIGAEIAGHSSLGRPIELTRANIRRVNPRSSHKVNNELLEVLLPSIFNINSGTSGVYAYDLSSQGTKDRSIWWDDTQTVYRIDGCVASEATFSASAGGDLSLDLGWAGKDFTTGVTYTTGLSIASMLGDRPFIFADGEVTIGGDRINTRSIRFSYNNGISNDRYFFGKTSAGPISVMRSCNISLDIPYGLHAGLRSSCNTDAGVSASVVFVNGTHRATFSFPKLRSVTRSIPANASSEMFLPFEATVFDIRTVGSEATPSVEIETL